MTRLWPPQTARPGSLDGVSSRRGRAAAAGPVGVEKLAARFVHALVGVRAEVIALGLKQVRRQHGGAILIVKRERGAERRHGDATLHRGRHNVAPAFLATFDLAAEIIVE